MARPEKTELVKTVTEKLVKSSGVVLADYRGLTVLELSSLRGRLRAEGAELRVVKNRLGKLALKDAECDTLDEYLEGTTIWAFGIKDPVSVAKVMTAYAKENEKLVIKGGLLERKRLNPAGVKQVATMPTRPELLAMMAGGMKQPGAKMARAMSAAVVKVAHGFGALAKKLEAGGQASA